MQKPAIFIGETSLQTNDHQVVGDFVERDEQTFYRIANYDHMRPFFMSLVSHSDHWMFISSNGGLSAGRADENSALFPYYTDDKITDGAGFTGSTTLIRVHAASRQQLWEPFTDRYSGVYQVTRNIYKSTLGNHLIFEEINHDLNLAWRYSWQFSQQFGFVRQSRIRNIGPDPAVVEILDGLQNLLPYGITAELQNSRSNLANAYKRCELDADTGIGIFSLSSMIVDKAEPSEALGATIAWHSGIKPQNILLSTLQVDQFRFGRGLTAETDIKAEPGAYLLHAALSLGQGEGKDWHIMADVNRDHSDIARIRSVIQDAEAVTGTIEKDIRAGSMELKALVARADGLQMTGDLMSVSRHYSNVLFNIMRGGIFEDQYQVRKQDLIDYFKIVNLQVVRSQAAFFAGLPEGMTYQELIQKATDEQHADLIRISYEYLPLSFSRRHGDPSRPWNKFSIDGKREDGSRSKNYEGNWRDIFQNWEALGLAFPGYIASMITKFVNASTIDGYNPYRITRDGIDWEVIEPDDPWSYIGYWGDHQIIYLLKLLEIYQSHDPGGLEKLLPQEHFVYANVPYRIRSYTAIVENPQDTIDFDNEIEHLVESRVAAIGGDGKLVQANGQILRVSLVEKLLLTLLTKVSNFIPDAGIWMNTQRPEWNDANNALVGNGVSMVTLCYLYRYVSFLSQLFKSDQQFALTAPLAEFLHQTHNILNAHSAHLEAGFDDHQRRAFVDLLGTSGQEYRDIIYNAPTQSTVMVDAESVASLLRLCQQYFEASIHTNKSNEGLYHAYNLIRFNDDTLEIRHLYEMLEGQVAVLSAGLLGTEAAAELLDRLKASAIYREDQYSYMLYPNRELPGFLQKNQIPESFAERSDLIKQMLDDHETRIVRRDVEGKLHFHRDFHNAEDLKRALDKLKTRYPGMVENEYQEFLDVFEKMFNHSAFTGRSGTFYGYEGLGSIYWHMVSKLLVAVQENIRWSETDDPAIGKLVDHYYEIRAGIGMHKTPERYGSFPSDPYSHTPWGKGVQQPGMTGQVKEDILNRWAELGISVDNGAITFNPQFLSPDEFLKAPGVFEYIDVQEEEHVLELAVNQLAFTYCQVPVVYERGEVQTIEVTMAVGETVTIRQNSLPKEMSAEIFMRTGAVAFLKVGIAIK